LIGAAGAIIAALLSNSGSSTNINQPGSGNICVNSQCTQGR
jgi:hypothetical protein